MTSTPSRPLPKRLLLGLALVALASACQDSTPTDPDVSGPQFDISEARIGDGNPDFFFASPLATDPQPGDANYDEGAAHELLVPYLRVCETDGSSDPSGCTADVTEEITGEAGGLPLVYDADAELYQGNLSTRAFQEGTDYRIEIWGLTLETGSSSERAAVDPRWLFGWRDLSNSPSTASCDGTEEYCLINYGQTVPVKVRIEAFVFCPVSRDCAVQFVSSGVDANLEALLGPDALASSAQLYIPGQDGTDFPLAFEPCNASEEARVAGAVDIPTFGPCLKTVTPPTDISLVEPVVVSLCEQIDEGALGLGLADPSSQLEQLTLHHFDTDGDPAGPVVQVEAWPHAHRCASSTSGGLAMEGSPEGLASLARAVGGRLLSWVRPRSLVALDVGGGGIGFSIKSFYKLGLPAKFEYETVGDRDQTGRAGDPYVLRAKVTDLLGGPVWNARVRWSVDSSPGGDAAVSATPVLTGSDGISEAEVVLSATEGDNVFHASGRGIADAREASPSGESCTLPGGAPGEAACNGPRESFDPFFPLNEFQDGVADGSLETLPEGTRLEFTVFGCAPGRGTPEAVDGHLAEGEWSCAKTTTFPVNLSGGSTQEATLFWMNDDESLHLAVRVPGAERRNALRIEWDNDGDGTPRELGDDIWEFDPGSGPGDGFVDEQCAGSSQSSCGLEDGEFGGAAQTVAAFDNSRDGATVYEISHPLSTGDTCTVGGRKGCGTALGEGIDLDVASGDVPGAMFTLQLGNGAQGNTQWPAFLEYFPIEIR